MRKITISPVGTCRINTPLKRGRGRYPVELDLRRIYGFVHTSEEALQQLQYRTGQRTFPADVLPILFRPGMEVGGEPVADRAADLTIVEISSAKSYTIEGVAVQANYLTRYFADFFASVPRTRVYWNLAGKGDGDALLAFLEKHRPYQLYTPEERSLLARMRVRQQTYEDVLSDMTAMVDLLGKDHVMFVTHVNAVTEDGSLVPSREKLIRWVKRAAQELEVECFDPTALMNEFGQSRALERGGLDLTHFTNAFCDRWYAHVQRDYVLKSVAEGELDIETTGDHEGAILADSIAAAMAHDDYFDGTRQLFAALKGHPDNVALQLLRGQVLVRIGDFEGASRVLLPYAAAPEMTADLRQSLMRALLETGDPVGALAIADQLLTDEYENDEIYEIAGRAADRIGQTAEALRYRKLAFRHDSANHAAAISVLDHYTAADQGDLYAMWLQEVLELLDSFGAAAPALAIAEWAIARREEEALRRALVVLARADMVLIPALMEEAARLGMEAALVPIAATIVEMPNLTEKTRRALNKLAIVWSQQAERLKVEGDVAHALALVKASLAVLPMLGAARRLRRAMAVELLVQIRAAPNDAAVVALCARAGEVVHELSASENAYTRASDRIRRARAVQLLARIRSAPDDAAVVALCAEAGESVFDLSATAQAYLRALITENRLTEAQTVAKQMMTRDPESIDSRANLAHIAELNGDFRTALELYVGLAAESGDIATRHKVRLKRFLTFAAPRGVRQIRALLADDRAEDCIAIWRLLCAMPGLEAAMANEALRIRSALRNQLKAIDYDEGCGMGGRDPLEIYDLMLQIAPDDTLVLRRAALEAMRQQQFEKAIGYWQTLDTAQPGLHEVAQFLERCRIRAHRQVHRGIAKRPASLLTA